MKNQWLAANLSRITRPVAAIKSLRFALFGCRRSRIPFSTTTSFKMTPEISKNILTIEVPSLKSLLSRRHTFIFNCWVLMPSFSSGLFRHTVRWRSRLRWIDLIPCLHTRPTWEVARWHHNMETWWRHYKERRSSLLVLCEGNHRWFPSLRASSAGP